MVMKTVNVMLNSLQPLLMNSNRGVNTTDPLVKELKAITSKRKKTDEDQEMILELKWNLALYYDKNIGPYIPAICIEGCIRDAAKKVKRGKDVTASVRVDPDFIPLEYEGPRTREELWGYRDGLFKDVRVGKIQGSSVVLCRPRFDHWKISFLLSYDDEFFNIDEIRDFLVYGGKYGGLCDYRQRYGKFTPVIEEK